MKRAKHIDMTEKEFRAWKRKHYQALKKAFDAFRVGCAYTPCNKSQVGKIDAEIKSIYDQCKDWWRKA